MAAYAGGKLNTADGDRNGVVSFSATNGSGTLITGLTVTATSVTTTLPITASAYKLSALNTAPTSATDTGTLGEIRIAANYIYVCTATNVWVRSALTTW